MKKLLLILLVLTSQMIHAQKITDTAETYISFAPCITNELGNFQTKFSPTIEIGKQFDGVFTTGFAIGKTNCSSPYSWDDIYFEFRPNLNVFQMGRFTNTLTTGVGYVCEPNESLILELTTGIEYAYSPQWHVNFFFGNYYYSSFSTDINKIQHYSPTFFGFSIVRFFRPTQAKGLFKVR